MRRGDTNGPRRTRSFHARRVGLFFAAVALLPAAAIHPPPTQQEEIAYALPGGVSLALPRDWVVTPVQPPSASVSLTDSAPPLQFVQVLVLQNDRERSILDLGVSNNMFLGRDAYWMDTQLHSPNSSGLSLPDFLFYFFFPPPRPCLATASDAYAGLGRASIENGGSPDLQVYLECRFAPTLSDFFSAQIASGVILRHTEQNVLRAIGVVNDFYLAPMEEVDFSGMTFFVFEAREPEGITQDVARRFNLPDNLAGVQSDFFWAVGARSPFPFASNATSKGTRLIHLAYATLNASGAAHDDFLDLLYRLRSE